MFGTYKLLGFGGGRKLLCYSVSSLVVYMKRQYVSVMFELATEITERTHSALLLILMNSSRKPDIRNEKHS